MTPGQKIVKDAFDAFARWERKYAEDLGEIELMDRLAVYSHWCAVGCIDLAKAMARADANA